jgi:hypothetical protein
MKMGSTALTGFAVLVIVLGLAAAVWGEISVLRGADLGPIYIAILGIETLIVMSSMHGISAKTLAPTAWRWRDGGRGADAGQSLGRTIGPKNQTLHRPPSWPKQCHPNEWMRA